MKRKGEPHPVVHSSEITEEFLTTYGDAPCSRSKNHQETPHEFVYSEKEGPIEGVNSQKPFLIRL